MKRLHVHLSVDNLEQNINFYSTMFGCQPTVQHDDYAKWMLDDPQVNFAISNRSEKLGLDHLGIQAENETELQAIKQQLDVTQVPIEAQEGADCCYTRSDKYWVTHWGVSDPGHVEGTDEEKITAFEQTFATLKLRVEKMLELPLETLHRDKLKAELNAIGQLTA
jgi:catechol 2,3-dioxygenase-like lactoylglutathione lyase family enzyme